MPSVIPTSPQVGRASTDALLNFEEKDKEALISPRGEGWENEPRNRMRASVKKSLNPCRSRDSSAKGK